jgi:hypothetical protein
LDATQVIKYSIAMRGWIKTKYPKFSIVELTKEFNRIFDVNFTEASISAFIKNNGIQSGRTGRFEKGSIPYNAGTKGIAKPNAGTFKKGNIPANIRPMGSERMDNRDRYLMIKVPEKHPYTGHKTRFKHKHIVIWEKQHGPVPKNMVILFRDGNVMNCTIENLVMISRAELIELNRHRFSSAPLEIKSTIFAMSKLSAKIFALRMVGKQ